MASYAKFFSIGGGGGSSSGLKLKDDVLISATLTEVVDKDNTPSILSISTESVGIGTTTATGLLNLFKPSAAVRLMINGDAGQNRLITYRTGGVQRIGLYLNNTAETGSNVGSDFAIRRYTDAGALGGTPLFVKRSSGNVGINTLTPAKVLDVNGDALINTLTVGLGSGNVATNTAVGFQAALTNTTGTGITAIGYQALRLSTGNNNTGVGNTALAANTTGTLNTAFGCNAASFTTVASGTTAIGESALRFNTTGNDNTAVGVNSLLANTQGRFNTALGAGSLSGNTLGIANTAVGLSTLASNTSGIQNTAIGVEALSNNTQGQNNTAIGFNSGLGITTGSNNTILGTQNGNLSSTLANTLIIQNGSGNQRILTDFNGLSYASGSFASIGDFEASIILAKSLVTLSSGGTTALLLDGGNLIIPSGTNRLWAAKITSSAFVSVAGGVPLTVGNSYMVETNVLIKKVGGVTSIAGVNAGNAIYDINMQTSFFSYTIGASQNLVITFNAPSTATSTTFRCASKIELVESAF